MIKSDNSIKRISFMYLLSLLPLLLFGFYKNGISLYIKKYVNIYGMIRPLLFIIVGFIIGIFVNIFFEKCIKKSKDKINDIIFSSFHPIYGILIACIISINCNILLFSLVSFIVLFISKFIKNNKINYVSFASLIIFLIMNIFGKFTFLNIYEASNKFNLNAIDYMFGKGSGGIFTTNIILLVVSFIFLYNIKTYKKSISISSISTFVILVVSFCIIKNDIDNIMNILFTNGILFSFI